MSITPFSLDFQGELAIEGSLDEAGRDQLRREAFPFSPPFDPSTVGSAEAPWRAFKLVPMLDGRLMVSVVSERGNTDAMGRPVSSATGCLLTVDALDGPLRDIGSLWRALDHLSGDEPPAAERLLDALHQSSPLCSDAAFAVLADRYRERGPFYAAAAAALTQAGTVDLILPMDASARRHLLPVLLLVPLDRLLRLHLATGSEASDHRERVLGVDRAPPSAPPAPASRTGLIGSFFSRSPAPEPVQAPPRVDFRHSKVSGLSSEPGPEWLTRLGSQPSDWPDLTARERFALLVRTGDARTLRSGPTTLFDRPELARLRRLVQELEAAEAGLQGWR